VPGRPLPAEGSPSAARTQMLNWASCSGFPGSTDAGLRKLLAAEPPREHA
jgi:hypothetical protein